MNKTLILPSTSVIDTMKKLDELGSRCLIVIDKKNKLLGTITDGDIRRGILSGINFSESIQSVFNKKPIKVNQRAFNKKDANKIIKKYDIELVPIVNDQNIVKDVFFRLKGQDEKKIEDISVVIMAGGKGTRMAPFTKVFPKPLVPVHDKPILEHIINNFTSFGLKNFHLTVNYKSKILKAYFEELQPDYNISFIDELEPLGTAGSIRLLERQLDKPFFVTNCDILIQKNYNDIYEFHMSGEFDVTLVASAKEYIIPYGTCEIDKKGHLIHINEKPKYDFLINTGFYVLNPEVIKLIPKNTFFHLTHLIENVKNKGKKVGVFPIGDDSWLDVGEWSEYKKAIKNF